MSRMHRLGISTIVIGLILSVIGYPLIMPTDSAKTTVPWPILTPVDSPEAAPMQDASPSPPMLTQPSAESTLKEYKLRLDNLDSVTAELKSALTIVQTQLAECQSVKIQQELSPHTASLSQTPAPSLKRHSYTHRHTKKLRKSIIHKRPKKWHKQRWPSKSGAVQINHTQIDKDEMSEQLPATESIAAVNSWGEEKRVLVKRANPGGYRHLRVGDTWGDFVVNKTQGQQVILRHGNTQITVNPQSNEIKQ